jgi:hypothetical protein
MGPVGTEGCCGDVVGGQCSCSGLGEGDGGVEVRWLLKLDVNAKTIGQAFCLQKPLLSWC